MIATDSHLLADHGRALAGTTLAELLARDPDRFSRLSFAWDGWLVDLSKERLGPDTLPLLVANALAQAQALLVGRSADTIRMEMLGRGTAAADLDAAVAARLCPGNRASTMLLPELSSYPLGQLLALHEHRTFVEAVLYGINPFDQFGAEFGKTLAEPIVAALSGRAELPPETDASTRGLVAHVLAQPRLTGG
jgi:glucose-6-phosphate isomerase